MKNTITYHSPTSASLTGEYARGNVGGYRTIWRLTVGDSGEIKKDELLIANANNSDCEKHRAVSMRDARDCAEALGAEV
jgi:hypothetical protein